MKARNFKLKKLKRRGIVLCAVLVMTIAGSPLGWATTGSPACTVQRNDGSSRIVSVEGAVDIQRRQGQGHGN